MRINPNKLNPYREAIHRISGVNGTGQVNVDGNNGLHVTTQTAQDAKFVDQIISDTIQGLPVIINDIGLVRRESLGAETTDRDKVLETLASLPGANGSGITEKDGQEALTVYAETSKDIAFLDHLLEDRIMGSSVIFVEQGPVSFEAGGLV